jgi:sugar lactone lactonase YvrE
MKDVETYGIAADSSGNLYVSDGKRHVIYRVVIATGVRTIFVGQLNTAGNSDNTGTNATFEGPGALVLVGTTLYVLDTGNNRVRQINTSTGVVSHYAGSQSKVAGSGNGSGTNITFQNLSKITADTSGNLFITQGGSSGSIRRVSTSQVASTYASNINDATAIAVDSSGNVYVAMANSGIIRRYTAADSGTTTFFTVLAGNGLVTLNYDGVGTNVGIVFIWGMVEVSGVLYVLTGDATIRKIVIATATVSTVAGEGGNYGTTDGVGIRARFGLNPRELAYRDGVLYVADCGSYAAGGDNSVIRRVDIVEPYSVSTFAGSGTQGYLDGASNVARFDFLAGNLACDASGNIYVADRYNHRIRRISSGGVVTTFAGSGTASSVDGVGVNATFSHPTSVVLDPTGSILYVCEVVGQRIRRIDIATAVVTLLAGSGTTGSADGVGTNATFRNPQDITTDSYGNIFVAETGANRIRKVTQTGVVSSVIAQIPGFLDGGFARFSDPFSITVGPSGSLYIADYTNRAIRNVVGNSTYTVIGATGFTGNSAPNIYRDSTISTRAMVFTPNGVLMDKASNLYISERTPGRIRVLKPDGVVTTVAGGAPGFANGIGTVAQFRDPFGMTMDSSGNLYVADASNYRVRKITMNSFTYSTSAPPIPGFLSSNPYSPNVELITIPSSTPANCNIANFTISRESLPTVSSVDGTWNLTLDAIGNASTPTSVFFRVFDGLTLVGTGNTISLNQSTANPIPYNSSIFLSERTYTSNLTLSLYTAATTSTATTLYLNSSNSSYLKTAIPNQSNMFQRDITFAGINCNAPQTNLDVRGNVLIWSDYNQSNAANRPSTLGTYGYGVGVDTLILKTTGAVNSNSNTTSLLFMGGANGFPFARISGIDTTTGGTWSGDTVFETQYSGVLYERMRITGIGNVSMTGILSFPNTGSYGAIHLRSSAENCIYIADANAGGAFTGWFVGQTATFAGSNAFTIGRLSGGNAVPAAGIYILSNGFVGVGRTVPTTTLDVNGNLRAYSFYSEKGEGTSGGGALFYFYLLPTNIDYILTVSIRDQQRTNATVGAAWLLKQGGIQHTIWTNSGTPGIGISGGYVVYNNNTGGDRYVFWSVTLSCVC